MGKPEATFIDSNGAEHPLSAIDHARVHAIPAGPAAVVIRAKDGVWPEPPSAGSWSRDEKTGDLTLVQAVGAKPEPEDRAQRRQAQREAALQAAAKKTHKE